ncbi:MAG TPA: TlpA disulfide reductase family protein [Solirubrobacteraceae bacterium]|jgi:thiol-disulfide isomerase/thioredoxin|nr:TlpA disulfide reductase family protein [Solirubrobacteraceae bacterium]
MTRRLGVLASLLTAAAVIALLVVFGLASSSPTGRFAPALPRELLMGSPVTLSSLLSGARGRAAVVVFWASWCGPCAKEAPALERFSESAVGRGRIVGVDWSDARPGARSFMKRYRWTFPNVRDAEGTVGNAYRLIGLPTTFVIDTHGRIRKVLRGPQSAHSLQVALTGVERS